MKITYLWVTSERNDDDGTIRCDGRQTTIVVNFGLLLLNKPNDDKRGNQNFHLYQSVRQSFTHSDMS